MQLKVGALGECSATHVANVWLDPRVRSHVSDQRTTLGKTFAAHLAQKTFLRVFYSLVTLHVIRERLFLGKRLWTHRTSVGSVVFFLKFIRSEVLI